MRTDLPNSSIYDEDYFLSSACDGLSEYLAGSVSVVKGRELSLLGIAAGQRVLDLGCGRGEVSAEIFRRGASVASLDYSTDAVRLTKGLIGPSAQVVRGDGSKLPFRDAAFDRVLLGDVIEHLPWPLATQAIIEVERVLVPGGRALIHTSPNTWFISLVKPVLVLLLRLLRRSEVLERFSEYDRLREAMHPNELNPRRFPRLMKESGVDARVWVDRDVLRSGASEWTEQLSARRAVRALGALAGAWPLRLLLGNDMYALIEKPSSTAAPKSSR